MKFLIIKTTLVYEKDVKDTLANEFETNDLQIERGKLLERYKCKEVHFNFIDQELDVTSKRALYAKIDNIIANEFGTQPVLMRSRSKKREAVDARNTGMWWHLKNNSGSQEFISKIYGNFDRTTIIAANKKINNLLETDSIFKGKIDRILAEIEQLKR